MNPATQALLNSVESVSAAMAELEAVLTTQNAQDLSSSLDEFTSEEVSIILESALYAMTYRYDGLADHLDLDDETLRPLVKKYRDYLLNQ